MDIILNTSNVGKYWYINDLDISKTNINFNFSSNTYNIKAIECYLNNTIDEKIIDFSITPTKIYDLTTEWRIWMNQYNNLRVRLQRTSDDKWYSYYFITVRDYITIQDSNNVYKGNLNYDNSMPTLKNFTGITGLLNNRYPYINNNSLQNYYTGTITASFVAANTAWSFNNWGYVFDQYPARRQNFKDWLYNGLPKLIKLCDGRIFIAGISGNINDNISGHIDNVTTSFDWYQIANYTYSNLYEYGFIGNKAEEYEQEPPSGDSLLDMKLIKLLKFNKRDESDVINLQDHNLTQLREFAFANSPIIVSVQMNALESIANYAFYGCTNLTTISIPKVVNIGSNVFNGCTNLNSLKLGSSTMATLSNINALEGTKIANNSETSACIYVPSSLVNSYKTATNWSTYASKITAIT